MSDADVLRYAAFTDAGVGGNPAGVVLDARDLDRDGRLAIAASVNFSETAFLEPDPSDGRRFTLRFFSPRAEVAFCGHATIAAAVALAERVGTGPLHFDTLSGPVPVETRLEGSGVVATLTSPPARTQPADASDVAEALGALDWHARDLDVRYPAHVAWAGVSHLILAAATRERLARLSYDFDALGRVMARTGWTTVQLVHAASPDHFSARNPFPPGGVVEDPATGAAAAAFGGYLRALDLVEVPGRVTIIQGEEMGRRSCLIVDLDAGTDHVRVSGAASKIAGPPWPA